MEWNRLRISLLEVEISNGGAPASPVGVASTISLSLSQPQQQQQRQREETMACVAALLPCFPARKLQAIDRSIHSSHQNLTSGAWVMGSVLDAGNLKIMKMEVDVKASKRFYGVCEESSIAVHRATT
ncbi:uncharacterized protein [Elaeis guineensis]|uniref:Uncharacterized protein LOC105039867 isoform X2 n=1 Tax=Elaeis guineensis var. tenera TaxID=51953 RepID=A0A6I9QSB3_ELAGV|nr:uncharacterized protein LOC105039867 isoform X2 [Elaeis guineensis]